MTNKTLNQIAEMKKQTIGAEVEMNNITRDKAAKLAAEYFGTGRYENTASRNGYMTWSAWDGQGREWKFQKDVSIAGPDAQKCEMVTPILTYADMENLQEITLSYQNRLVIKLGTGNNLPYKLQLTGVIVRNDDGNCLSDSDRGTLDVSYVKKDGTIEPVFRSENDIDITAAISADSQTQEGEENTEDADGTTAPTE